MASLGSLPLWCKVRVTSLQEAGTDSSCLSYCIRSLPEISSLQASAARACGASANAAASASVPSAIRGKDMSAPSRLTTSVRHSQTLMHHRARGGVLQELFLLGIQVVLNRERGQRRLVEPGQDQLLLARVGIDVADGEDAGHAGLELLGVDLQRALLQSEPPLGDRPELRMQPEEHQQLVGLECAQAAAGLPDLHPAQYA